MILRALLVLLARRSGSRPSPTSVWSGTGRRGWVPLACRAVAWAALGLLLLNVSCPVAGAPRRPLVLLDASLSMSAPGGRWTEARDSAARWGEVRTFGDERGSRRYASQSRAARCSGPRWWRPRRRTGRSWWSATVRSRTRRDLPPDLLARASVRLFPAERQARPGAHVR